MAKLKPSAFRQRIEQHLDELGEDVICRKRNEAYNLLWADDETLLARLKPTGQGDEVEIFWWDGKRWQGVDEFGCVMPLREAIDFVFDDPVGLFLEDETEEDGESVPVPSRFFGNVFGSVIVTGTLGGCLAGVFSDVVYGLVAGALVALLVIVSQFRRDFPWGLAFRLTIVVGSPAIFAAAVAGALGGALNEAVVTVWWGRIAGVLVGGACGFIFYIDKRLGWSLSFSAGLLLGMSVVERLGITQMHLVCLLAALSAAGFAKLCHGMFSTPMVAVGSEVVNEDARRRNFRLKR
jgi:hypothetical protein